MAIAPNISLVTITGEYVDYLGNPVAGQVTFSLPKTLLNALADQIVVQSSYSATLNAFGQFSITVPATDDPNFNETFQYTIVEGFAGGRTWQASLPGVDSFEDLQARYVTFAGLSTSGQTFSDLVGVSSVKMSDLVPAYTGGAFTELAAYQAYVVEEQAVTTQEGYISYAPAGVVLSSTYGNVAFVYDTYTEVIADRATYALLISTPVVAETADILLLDDIRVNLLTNPSFETNTTGWLPSNQGSIVRSTAQAYVGGASGELRRGAGSTSDDYVELLVPNTLPSTTYRVSAYLWLPSGAAITQVFGSRGPMWGVNYMGTVVVATSTANFSLTNQWQRISTTITTPAGSTQFYMRFYCPTGNGWFIDALQVEQGATLGSYFDGSFEGFWTGTAHASTSRNATVPSYATYAQYWADLAIEQAEELFPHPFIFTGSLGVER